MRKAFSQHQFFERKIEYLFIGTLLSLYKYKKCNLVPYFIFINTIYIFNLYAMKFWECNRCYGASLLFNQMLFSNSKRIRSCMRLLRPCQNSILLGTTL